MSNLKGFGRQTRRATRLFAVCVGLNLNKYFHVLLKYGFIQVFQVLAYRKSRHFSLLVSPEAILITESVYNCMHNV